MRCSIVGFVIFATALCALHGFATELAGKEADLSQALEARMKELRIVGAVVGIYAADKPPIELALGLADADKNRPMTTDCSFRIAGSKIFLGTALLHIAGEGKVSLDDPISKYVPGVPNGDRIKLRHLGSQRSGLFNHIQSPEVKAAFAAEPQRTWTIDELLAMDLKQKPYFEPGLDHHYANANTVLLAKVIEKVTGNPWQDEVRTRILEPLGMKQTFIAKDNTLPAPRAEGYSFGGERGPFFHHGTKRYCVTSTSPSWFGPATALVSTVGDLRKCAKPLATGALLTPEMRKELQHWTPADQEGYDYGFHMERYRGFMGHDGDMPGYQTAMYYSPTLDATIIALTNVYGWSLHDMPADRLVWHAAELALKIPAAAEEGKASLRQKLDRRRVEMDCPGALVRLRQGNQPPQIYELGVADVNTMAPLRQDMHMRLASASKMFLGTTVLLLADDKKLSLDDPISKYVEGVPAGDKITLRQLGNNTSGLFNSIQNRDFQNAVMKEPGKMWSTADILRYAFAKPSYHTPGERFHYSNTNAVLLGMAVEKVTGKPYGEVIAERVLVPLGLKHTGVCTTAKLLDPSPSAYRHGYEDRVIGYGKIFYDVSNYSGGWTGPAGNMYSTLEDLTRACKPLATGQLLSEAGKTELHRWVDTQHDGVKYGFCMGERNGAIGHTGDLPGFQAVVFYQPANDTTLVVLTNLSNNKDGSMPAEELAEVVRKQLAAAAPAKK